MSTRIREHAPALRAWVRITLLASLVLAAGTARAEGTASAPAKGDTAKASSSKPAAAPVKPAAVAKVPVKVGAAPAQVKPASVAPAPATPAAAPSGVQAKPATTPAETQAKPAATPAGTQARPSAPGPQAKPAPKAPPTKAAPGTPVPPTAKAQAGQKTADAAAVSKSSLVVTKPLDGKKAAANGVAPGGPQVTAPPAQLDEHITYQYNTLGRRDPFQSMLEGEFVGLDVGGDAPPDVGGLTVVGIVWGDSDRFALCEDARGNSHILRKGDKVMNGYVQELKRDGVVMNLTVDNSSESVTIPLTRKGEKKNASR